MRLTLLTSLVLLHEIAGVLELVQGRSKCKEEQGWKLSDSSAPRLRVVGEGSCSRLT